MLIDCMSVIRATGPDRDISRINHLLDSNAHQRGGDEVTYFMNIVDKFLEASMGLRWRSEETEDDIIWAGSLDWEPPTEFVKEMSGRFPEVTFQMTFTNKHADSSGTYEFKSGESRLLHERDEGFEYCGPGTSPVDHYRLSLSFHDNCEKNLVMGVLYEERLVVSDDDYYVSPHPSAEVLAWCAVRFPNIDVRVDWWLPYRRRADDQPNGKVHEGRNGGWSPCSHDDDELVASTTKERTMGLELAIACIPQARMNADRIQRLHDLVDNLDDGELEFEEVCLQWEDYTTDEVRSSLHKKVDLIAVAEDHRRDVNQLSFPELPFTILAAGGYTSSGPPSDLYEAFCIIEDCEPIRKQLACWAQEDKSQRLAANPPTAK
ncbi:hypothetical protein [Novipirellula artificiosorum]|uniref:Uncharacterized protein n=1 Tax=Novipirellula artificiosorum TaxID=2528016 RepID=A0A5C6CH50_9BACT|nr:hypothetical protein [Novipirellula artificiosorum]TWU22556.1 hypothetical protein Poly41_71210 [Novipirellula artificiosorum]